LGAVQFADFVKHRLQAVKSNAPCNLGDCRDIDDFALGYDLKGFSLDLYAERLSLAVASTGFKDPEVPGYPPHDACQHSASGTTFRDWGLNDEFDLCDLFRITFQVIVRFDAILRNAFVDILVFGDGLWTVRLRGRFWPCGLLRRRRVILESLHFKMARKAARDRLIGEPGMNGYASAGLFRCAGPHS